MIPSFVRSGLITVILTGLAILTFADRPAPGLLTKRNNLPYTQIPNRSSPTSFYSSCVHNESYLSGDYLVLNNQWNRRLMGVNDTYHQCIQVNGFRDPTIDYKWTWTWPKLQGQVKAFPEVIYGWAPWLDGSTTDLLPMEVSQVVNKIEFKVDFDTEVWAPGASYNTAFDLFLTSSAIPTPENRTHEIMIWVNDQNSWISKASKSYIGSLTIGGEIYDFWHSPNSQTLFLFRKTTPIKVGSIVINDFLNYLLNEGYLSGKEYLADIEFGNEIVFGSGQTLIRNYSISPSSIVP